MLRKSLNRLSAYHECYTVFSCINSTTGEPLTEWLAELNNKLPPFFVVPSDQHFRCVFRITSTERQIVHDCPVMLLYYSVQWCSPAPGLVCQVFRVWFPSSEFAITVIDPTRRADVEEQAACWRCGKSFCFHVAIYASTCGSASSLSPFFSPTRVAAERYYFNGQQSLILLRLRSQDSSPLGVQCL